MLLYTRYDFLIRFIVKLIAQASGGLTDTRRDHDYTDWAAPDRFVAAYVEKIVDDVPARARTYAGGLAAEVLRCGSVYQ